MIFCNVISAFARLTHDAGLLGLTAVSPSAAASGSPGPLILRLIDRGGWVMGVLLILSVVAVALCLERAWFWWRQRGGAPHVRLIAEALRTGDVEALRRLASRGQPRGVVVDQFSLALIEGAKTAPGERIRIAPSHILEAADRVRPRMERFMPALSTIVTAAPLLGILGTVVGIIASFELLGDARLVTDPRQVSGGIAEALLTTQAGLIIALLVLFPYMAFRHRLDRELGRLDLLIAAAEEGAEGAGPAPRHSSPSGDEQSGA